MSGSMVWLNPARMEMTLDAINSGDAGLPFYDWSWWMTMFQLFLIAAAAAYLLLPWPCRRGARRGEGAKGSADAAGPTGAPPSGGLVAVAPGNDAGEGAAAVADGAPVVPTEPAKHKPRVFYLDTLKTVLTFVVVVFHIFCGFSDAGVPWMNVYVCGEAESFPNDSYRHFWFYSVGGWFIDVNDAYFMRLFFFVSGLFTPSSLDRKGLEVFLADRLKRFGLPVLVYNFIIGPGIVTFMFGVIFGLDFRWGTQGLWMVGGPPWFIMWLLTFNVFYAFSHSHTPLNIGPPKATTLVMLALGMGVLMSNVDGQAFMSIPGGLQEFVPCVIFFACGILAKRNAWMEELEKVSIVTVRFLYGATAFLVFGLLWRRFVGFWKPEAQDYGTQTDFIKGVLSVLMSFVMMDFFRRRLNFGGRMQKIFSDAAYTVYIIHPVVVMLTVWSYVAIIHACGANAMKDMGPMGGGLGSEVPVRFVIESDAGEGLLWLGWFYTCVVSNLILWPLSYGLKQLPVLRDVL